METIISYVSFRI